MIRKIGVWFVGIVSGLILLFLVGIHIVTPIINGGEKAATDFFTEAGVDFGERFNHWGNRSLHWVETGNDSADVLIFFVHGAPGSWKDFSEYLTDTKLQENSFMVAPDRPGYGMSGYGDPESSIMAQADAAMQVLEKYSFSEVVLVGYSYGGPIAGTMAARLGPSLKRLIMLAPVNDPEHEKIFWFNHVIEVPLLNWILPDYIQVANTEKLNHANALEKIEDVWDDIDAPVTHVHCTDDWIAPFEPNVAFSRKNIPDSLLTLVNWTGDNHFLPNNVKERVLPLIYEVVGE